MAVLEGLVSLAAAEVGLGAQSGLHIIQKPIAYGSLGHYRVQARIGSTAAQAANARIFELRNTGANLIIPTRLIIRAIQTATGTAQENSVDVFRCTGFSAVDTTNTVTPTVMVKRIAGMTAAPGGAAVRVLNPAAAGMTGGTLTKDGAAFATFPYLVNTAIPTTANALWGPMDVLDDVNGTHPFVFANNEGFEIENRVLNVTSYGITWWIDLSWAEVTLF